ncbi:MAG: hypothetical protein L6420_11605 [Elusimicrobia bacterium]|nr:hypothetical protein [Elusimicrobiota bacterium]
MNKSLEEFKNNYKTELLSLLWRQWSSLGVAGYGNEQGNRIIDSEALLIFTCGIGRYDPRLFDEALDWLRANGDLINIQRLKMILREEKFAGVQVLAAIAATIGQGYKARKWKSLFENINKEPIEPLFYSPDNAPIKHFGKTNEIFANCGFSRGQIKPRNQITPLKYSKNALILKLRGLFGINARAEIITYLLTHETAHPSLIARETYFNQKTVQDAMVEMAKSGFISSKQIGREKRYWLNTKDWEALLKIEIANTKWFLYPPFLNALERIWAKLNESKFKNMNDLLLSSELRLIMTEIKPKFEQAGLHQFISDDKNHKAEQYIPVFISDINNILKQIKN